MVGLIASVYFFNTTETPVPEKEQPMLRIEKKEEQTDEIKENETMKSTETPIKEFLSEKLAVAASFFFTKEINIVTLGDSLTEGIGDETNNSGYVGVLDDTINRDQQLVHFQNFAKRGSRSEQLLIRLKDKEVTTAIKRADIILITIGANDIMQIFKENITKLTLDKFTKEQNEYEKRLHAIFTSIHALNKECDIYLVGFYNPFHAYFSDVKELELIVDNWNQIGADVTYQYEWAHFIPMKDLFENTTANYLSEDNFHLNHLGYKMMAERILHYVMNEGEQNDRLETTVERQ